MPRKEDHFFVDGSVCFPQFPVETPILKPVMLHLYKARELGPEPAGSLLSCGLATIPIFLN